MTGMKITLESLGVIPRSQEVSSKATGTEVQEACVLPTGKEVPYRLKIQGQKNQTGVSNMDPKWKFTEVGTPNCRC